ncbi:MAG TPA: uracil-DNA glycosylase family protein, partial [Thermoanaerobaculia bacterium]|nr:uracil-DNA glycosylase family protein [Thermoanaerobaculia bacterium]
LGAELERIAPEMIVCLGATATRAVLGPKVAVVRDHGKVFPSEWAPWVMPTYHPSALLRAPDDQRDSTRKAFRADLRIAARRYREITGTKREPKHEASVMRAQPGGDHGTRQGTRGSR